MGKPSLAEDTYSNNPRIELKVRNGIVLVAGDSHCWPGKATPAHRALVKLIGKLAPRIVCINGDMFDGARISRFPPVGWEARPTVLEELQAVQSRMHEIEQAAPKPITLIWTRGNHDLRFENRLASVAPEYANIHGFSLKDHVSPRWQACWSLWINDNTIIKHRTSKGGIHAAHNNVMWCGKNIIVGHSHQLKVSSFVDYGGVRWGAEHGCLADPYGPQFTNYTEDNTRLWQAGFLVLTFHEGNLLQPEIVRIVGDKHADFRGELIRI